MDLIEKACKDAGHPERCVVELKESLKNLKEKNLNFLVFDDQFVFQATPDEEAEKENWGLSPGE